MNNTQEQERVDKYSRTYITLEEIHSVAEAGDTIHIYPVGWRAWLSGLARVIKQFYAN